MLIWRVHGDKISIVRRSSLPPSPACNTTRHCFLLTASYLVTASSAVSPIRTMRHAAIIPALPFPALQWSETTFSGLSSSHAFAFSQNSTTDSSGGQVSSVNGYLKLLYRCIGAVGVGVLYSYQVLQNVRDELTSYCSAVLDDGQSSVDHLGGQTLLCYRWGSILI